MLIRPAQVSELLAVGELTAAAYVADGLIDPDAGYVGELRAADQRSTEAELMVAVEGDRLLGTVTFCLAGSPWAEICEAGEAEFRMLAVSPQARGRGVGSALASWCVDRAREQGSSAVALSSLPDMRTAHRIYERLGFVRAPGRDWRPADDVDLIAYVLDLRAQ
ncbi:MAG: GNAT family N-acetyltransferase [Sporichthyaceae bacterium]|nr:GNAT family N-acetyltransferase [Sporichthyaceae bacterium]